ncbi:GntR family transcriptional regulator [Roseospira marina]|uniref:GntR family transcriptional regulator n=1 Tax=Roseospira marina TaxID=140057 RepID=A0A5M6IH14_9PROT|nr:GntR family transcriptional regulator [Roseospira marina]KAA5607573.1 GntR family transcriptional regulator [Roseospira marina]MBB4312235.1 DNA-binding GntR family transcriptional regulator [Roseospira marina]MBB5085749.1 DNA-binding GntR family transcriptional regulator [Roseospira marina]
MTRPLSQQAYAKIIEMVFSGVLPAGSALHEARLSDSLDMSRTPVREAIKRMEYEGLLRREGRFLRVRPPTPAEIEEIFFLREAMEAQTARAAVTLPNTLFDEMTNRLRAFLAADGASTDGTGGSGDPAGFTEDEWRIDDAFHRMLARSMNNPILLRTLDRLRLRTYMFDRTRVPERFLAGTHEHLAILDALRAGDADTAERLTVAHLRNARDAVLSCLERYALGEVPR